MIVLPETPDEWTAAATVVNAVLVAVLVIVTSAYAIQTARTVDELRETRFVAFLPMLQWQTPVAGSRAFAGHIDVDLRVLLTNVGPGAARILAASAELDDGSAFSLPELGVPSTIGPGVRITLLAVRRVAPVVPVNGVVQIVIRYADLESLRIYETRPRIDAIWSPGRTEATFVNSDERSAQERRVR